MSIIRRMRRQRAIWWPMLGRDRFGEAQYGEPVEIACRWEDAHEEFLDNEGVRQISNAKVYVDREILNGVLRLGKARELNDHTRPFSNSRAYIVKKYEAMPDLKAKQILRTVML